jgi:broad specificity phosphatase PhoE
VRTLVVARHAESVLNADNILNGDPSRSVGLTARGELQAQALGAAVGPVDLVAHTSFERTRQTAVLAWPGTPRLLVPDLDEIRFGHWEGTRWSDGYEGWVGTAGPEDECPGGGESRVAAARRYVRGLRTVLARSEARIALVAHGAQVRYLLLARSGTPPTPVLERVDLAAPHEFSRDELERAIVLLDEWTATPTF